MRFDINQSSLTPLICVKSIVGFGVFQTSGNLSPAIWNSLVVLSVSSALGAAAGMAVPALLRSLGNVARDTTLAFAIAVMLLVAVTHVFKFSPVLATLTFGLVARHRRVALNRTERNFGVMGNLLTVLLFFYVATTLKWQHVIVGIPIALAIVTVRFVVKTTGVTLFARASGISLRKAMLTGMALTPMSVFAILLLEQTRRLEVDLLNSLAPLAAIALLLEIIGPILTQRALIWAKEIHHTTEA